MDRQQARDLRLEFMRDDKIHGNYTMRPLLKTMPEDEAEALRSLLADP